MAGIRMAVGNDKTASTRFKLKHLQREICSVTDPTDLDCFPTSRFFDHKAIMFFPNGSSAGWDGILPQSLKDSTTKSNVQFILKFLRDLTNLVNVIIEGKVPFELRPSFFGSKLIALKKPDGGRCVGNFFRRLSAKFAGYHVFESSQAKCGNRNVSRYRHQKGS